MTEFYWLIGTRPTRPAACGHVVCEKCLVSKDIATGYRAVCPCCFSIGFVLNGLILAKDIKCSFRRFHVDSRMPVPVIETRLAEQVAFAYHHRDETNGRIYDKDSFEVYKKMVIKTIGESMMQFPELFKIHKKELDRWSRM